MTTIEGLGSGASHPVQQAWIAEQVTQCGFCEPGFIMAVAALVDGRPDGARRHRRALPNICRCGAYPRIVKAIDARACKPERQNSQLGSPLAKLDSSIGAVTI